MLAAATTGAAAAQPLADPMRPPVWGAGTGGAGRASGPVVQMIVIAPERSYAVINGETVQQGGRFRGAHVVRIAETEVTLRDAAGATTVLKLLPQAQKKISASSEGEKGKQ
jgi:hypothetical protein